MITRVSSAEPFVRPCGRASAGAGPVSAQADAVITDSGIEPGRVAAAGTPASPAKAIHPAAASQVTTEVAGSMVSGPLGRVLRVTLAGAPGAGKTTHGTALAKTYNVPEISTGSLLREEVARGTALGKQAEPYLKTGDLVPIEIVSQVLENRLRQPDAGRGFILDGMPRRIEDAHLLEDLTRKLNLPPIPMLLLDVPDQILLERVENRRVCDNQHLYDLKTHPPHHAGVCDVDGLPLHRRADDNPEVLKHRLEVFHAQTEPVLDYYRAHGLLSTVDGVGSIDEVGARVMEAATHILSDR